MSETERLQAVIAELETQRNWALTRCAAMAAEIEKLKVKDEEPKEDA